MTESEIDKIYKKYDHQMNVLSEKRDALQDMVDAIDDQIAAISEERNAWERTLV